MNLVLIFLDLIPRACLSIRYDAHSDHLFTRLDFNGFYAAKLRDQAQAAAAASASLRP